jgi:hypothetical protein
MNSIRPGLVQLPHFMRGLPLDKRGYPVPWFVEWVNGEPEFRAMSVQKLHAAIKQRLCWVCGKKLFPEMVFVVGPMCTATRISPEAPCHRECALFAALSCPFLSKPQMTRRRNDLPTDIQMADGLNPRNPGATVLWFTRRFDLVQNGRSVLFRMGRSFRVDWYANGRAATPEEALEAFEQSMTALWEISNRNGDSEAQRRDMTVSIAEARKTLPRPR